MVDEPDAERFDKCRFSCPGNSGNAEADGFAGVRQQLSENLVGSRLMVVAGRFDQGDGFCKRTSLSGQNAVDKLLVCFGKYLAGSIGIHD